MNNKKQSFLHGAALLAGATAIVKIIGALYKIPLQRVIGDAGFGYFSTAYEIYTVLLLISTTGLPVAMSRLISQASSLDNSRQVRKIYTVSRAIFIGVGLVSALLMGLLCRQLANFQEQPRAWFAILCLAPCALLMGFISTYRGFFQGQGNMLPTSVSQVLEAMVKLLVGLAAAFLVAKYTKNDALAAGGAILGVTASCAVSAGYLANRLFRAQRDLPQQAGQALSGRDTAKQLLAIAVPITIGSAGMQILTVLETKLYMGQLLDTLGLAQTEADHMKGVYNMTQTVYNMPIAFIAPITISIIPAITSCLTLGDGKGARETGESAARICGLLSLPCAVGLMVLSRPIMGLLGGYTGEKLDLAAGLMTLLGISVFLHALVQLTNAIMQANGHAALPVANTLVCGCARLVLVYVLVGNPALGLLGVPLGTAICNFAIAGLNLLCMARVLKHKPRVLRNVLRPLLPTAIMGAVAWGSWRLVTQLLGENCSRLIQCGGPICLAGLVYVVCALWLRCITREDLQLLPKGDKLARLLRL